MNPIHKALSLLTGLFPLLAGPGELAMAQSQPQAAPASFPACLGETRSLIVSNGMPYTPLRVQGRTGFFVVDLGSDGSTITPENFLGGIGPRPLPNQGNGQEAQFADVNFFGPWQPMPLSIQNSNIKAPLAQAGLIGTNLLKAHVFTLDYASGLIHRADPATFCSDLALYRAGFRPLSSRDYYGRDPTTLRCPAAPRRPCPNIPTIPVRVGNASAVAQVDTGYDDRMRPGVNINRAWLRQLLAAGVPLFRDPAADISLTTCASVNEPVLAYRLPVGTPFELVGEDGQAVRKFHGIPLYLKDTPAAARSCGGIGTWDRPAAQLGASSINDGTLVVDPLSQRLWFKLGNYVR